MKKICITDSGFGGLSVCADLVKLLTEQKKAAEIIYFNACYAEDYGYNAIADREEKIKMFDRALLGMETFAAPDEILVACNTLSVLLESTSFVKRSSITIKSIVDTGVELIQKTLSPNEKVSIFGTETTIGENTYLNRLIAAGWDYRQVAQIACPGLQSAISDQNQLEEKVKEFTSEADKNSWYFLACTHFGIRADAFQHSKILDPNKQMAKEACERIENGGSIKMKMVSRYPMLKNQVSNWINLLQEPLTIKMLQNCEIKDDLF